MTSLPERLRQETRLLHQQTEQLFYTEALQNATLTVAQYEHLLRTHLVFHQDLETAIDQHSDFFRDYEPLTRKKTPWLLADLDYLNSPKPAPMANLFIDWSPIALLGAAYVGEGSMLGGTVIWKLLQNNKAIEPLLAQTRFYQGYGSATGNYWRNFGSFLTRNGSATPDVVIEAAKQAFVTYQQIFEQTEPVRLLNE
ncbi:biliverdin-producing heme oxygenase [Spirosoma sp. SC4-14]|uniref:biliverdin-producing heme oxygenase n=1 Tax=Spirosoma sp. SC4-14 TaxID=3128900 RepID=UPI0030CF97F3